MLDETEASKPPDGTEVTHPLSGRTDLRSPGLLEFIGPYRLLQRIGEGGMGEVWQAEQTEPVRRRVAIKVIKQGMDTREVIARFEAERQALAMMDHSCVAKVFDAGSTPEGRPYFVMEYVAGIPITEHCDSNNLTTGERLGLFMQVCDGVQHAHQKAIIHRDLKPSNVLVSLQDGRAVPKIIDFGVAKATAQKLTEKTLFTEMGVLIGTPEYMSPEQAALTAQDVDTRTDVYSLGVMLYELLVGALPFAPKELREAGFDSIRRIIREVEPQKPSTRLNTLEKDRSTDSAKHRRVDVPTLRRQLSGDLDWITMKALEKDRTRRYGSATELALDLGRHLRHEPVLAGPPGAAYRARKFVRRHRFGVAATIAAVLVVVGVAVMTTVQARRIAREAEAKRLVSEFLTRLFEVSDPSEARGNKITARELLDKGAGRIRGTLADDPKLQADLMLTMGTAYRGLGLYPSAEPLLGQALETRRRLLGKEDPESLRAAAAMARLYGLQGRYREAEALDRETLDIQKRVLGPERPETLVSMNDLATVCMNQGRYKEAEALFREALDIQKRVLGPEHPDALVSMRGLGRVCLEQGRYQEAEAFFREALDIQKRILGPEHPETLKLMMLLANARLGQRHAQEAEALGRETLEIQRRVLGPAHPETMFSMNNLANALVEQGRYKEAEALYREALDIAKPALGPEHPFTLALMHNLARTYDFQGRYQEAEALHRETLEVRKRVLGLDHPDTLISMTNLANALSDQRRYREAESLHRETVDLQKRVLGPNHPQTVTSIYNLGCVAALQGRRQEALAYLRDAVEHGYSDPKSLLEDSDLASLRGDTELDGIVAAAKENRERVARSQ